MTKPTLFVYQDEANAFWDSSENSPMDLELIAAGNMNLPSQEAKRYNAIVELTFERDYPVVKEIQITFLSEEKEPEEPQFIIPTTPKKQPLNQVLQALRQSEDWQEYDHFCQLLLNRIARLEGFEA